MNLDFITDKLPWRVQSFLGYRPVKSITAKNYYQNKFSSPNLETEFLTQVLQKGEIELKPAISLNNNEHIHFTEITKKAYDECLFFSLNNAKYIQHNFIPTVIDNKNRLICDANKDPKKGRELHPIFTVAKLSTPKKLNGKVLLLSTDGGHNGYFHWLCRILPKLWVLEKYHISINQFDYILINAGDFNFKHVSFKEFNIPKEKIVFTENEEIFQCNQLFVINNIRYHTEGIEYVRNKLLLNKNNEKYPKRIYLSRQKARFRKIINEQILIDYLIAKEFKIINFEDYSLKEQASLINNCDILIGTHGAGFSNIIFANPKMKFIEILPDNYVNVNYWFYSNILHIDYYYYLGQSIIKNENDDINQMDLTINNVLLEKLNDILF